MEGGAGWLLKRAFLLDTAAASVYSWSQFGLILYCSCAGKFLHKNQLNYLCEEEIQTHAWEYWKSLRNGIW